MTSQIEHDKRRKALSSLTYAVLLKTKVLHTSKFISKSLINSTQRNVLNTKKKLFKKCFQKESHNIDQFHTRLLTLAENYEFAYTDLEFKMQIIRKCKSDNLREKALQQKMIIKDILSLERFMEIHAIQAAEISAKSERTYKITKTIHKKPSNVIRNVSAVVNIGLMHG